MSTESAARQLLTASRLKAARACQRKHRLLYGLGIRPVKEAETLRFGTLVHKGLEAWWKSAQAGVIGDEQLAATLAALQGEADPFDLVRAEELLRGYHYRWLDSLAHYEVIAVEVQFQTRLVNPQTGYPSQTWDLGGKIDAIVRDRRDGLVRVIEHKTSSEDIAAGSDYWVRLRMDGQVSIYFEGARALGHDVAGCIYDVIKKPGIRPLEATPVESRKYTKAGALYANQRAEDETPEEFRARLVVAIADAPDAYFARGDVVRLDEEMSEALWDIWQLAQQLHAAEAAERFPRNPDACQLYGRPCPFRDVCSGLASIDDTTRFRRSESVHPELAPAPA